VVVVSNGAAANGSDKARRVNPIKLKQMQERLAAVEAEMPRLEASILEAEQALGVFVSAEETARASGALDALREKQALLTEEWEDLMLLLEEG
jgi:ATP-binding cassette subfamily F protein 3